VRSPGFWTGPAKVINIKEGKFELDAQRGKWMKSDHVRLTSGQECVQYDCPGLSPNQFPKWVNWRARYVDNLNSRFNADDTFIKHNDAAWVGVESHMVLDIDQRAGRGPETVTFQNVPPGTYQLVVDRYTQTEGSLADADPKVNIMLGGGSDGSEVGFICELPRSCTNKNTRFWVVAEIKIEKGMDDETYRVRMVDEKSSMTALKAVSLPTTSKKETAQPFVAWTSQNEPPFEYKQGTGKVREPYFDINMYKSSDPPLACYGRCQPAPSAPDWASKCCPGCKKR